MRRLVNETTVKPCILGNIITFCRSNEHFGSLKPKVSTCFTGRSYFSGAAVYFSWWTDQLLQTSYPEWSFSFVWCGLCWLKSLQNLHSSFPNCGKEIFLKIKIHFYCCNIIRQMPSIWSVFSAIMGSQRMVRLNVFFYQCLQFQIIFTFMLPFFIWHWF